MSTSGFLSLFCVGLGFCYFSTASWLIASMNEMLYSWVSLSTSFFVSSWTFNLRRLFWLVSFCFYCSDLPCLVTISESWDSNVCFCPFNFVSVYTCFVSCSFAWVICSRVVLKSASSFTLSYSWMLLASTFWLYSVSSVIYAANCFYRSCNKA